MSKKNTHNSILQNGKETFVFHEEYPLSSMVIDPDNMIPGKIIMVKKDRDNDVLGIRCRILSPYGLVSGFRHEEFSK